MANRSACMAYIKGGVPVVGSLLVFLFFYLAYPYHLMHKEQLLLFFDTPGAWGEYLRMPAIAACFVGDFLTQYFRYPAAGAAIVSLSLLLLGAVAYRALRSWLPAGWAWGLAALLFVWEGFRQCGMLYPLSATWALAGGFGLFLLAKRLPAGWIRKAGWFIGALFAVWLFGYGLYAFLGCALGMILRQPGRAKWFLALGLTLHSLAQPMVAARRSLLTWQQAYSYPSTGWGELPDPLHERLLGMDAAAEGEQWEKLLQLAHPSTHTRAGAYYYNLANAMRGQLPDRLLTYDPVGVQELFLPVSSASSYLSTLFAGEVWFQLGDLTMAEHATMLGMIFSPRHRGSRMVRRLAEISLLRGDERGAMKYLRILGQTAGYRSWAAERIPGRETPSVRRWLAAHRARMAEGDTLRTSTVDIVRSLRLLLESHPEHTMARDYLLCFHLLRKDIAGFVADYRPTPGVAPKRIYAEALLIDLVRRKAPAEEIREAIVSPSIMRDFKEYTRMHGQAQGNPAPLAARFGKSYWFYYHFANNNPE